METVKSVPRHVPERMCMVCRGKKPKWDLIRIVKTEDGLVFDPDFRMNGRGAYICKSQECIEKAKKHNIPEKVLKTTMPEETWEKLIKIGICVHPPKA